MVFFWGFLPFSSCLFLCFQLVLLMCFVICWVFFFSFLFFSICIFVAGFWIRPCGFWSNYVVCVIDGIYTCPLAHVFMNFYQLALIYSWLSFYVMWELFSLAAFICGWSISLALGGMEMQMHLFRGKLNSSFEVNCCNYWRIFATLIMVLLLAHEVRILI